MQLVREPRLTRGAALSPRADLPDSVGLTKRRLEQVRAAIPCDASDEQDVSHTERSHERGRVCTALLELRPDTQGPCALIEVKELLHRHS